MTTEHTLGNALASLDDTALIDQCRIELPYVMHAFSELVKRHERYVFNVCRRYLGSEDDAEDSTQEVFMRVFHALPQFEGRSQFRTWLYRIAMNQCHEAARKNKRYQALDDEDYTDEPGLLLTDEELPDYLLDAEDEQDCVQRSLAHMRTQDMEILNLRFMGELSLEDIAHTLGHKLSATKMRFYRAMASFRAIYEKLCM